jgi:capsular polysaccharide biosynthesis protein
MKKDMLFLCIERIFGLISGCRNLELFFADYRSNTMILVHKTKEDGERLKEKED